MKIFIKANLQIATTSTIKGGKGNNSADPYKVAANIIRTVKK